MDVSDLSLKDFADKVNKAIDGLSDWQLVREDLINRHENAVSVEEYITLLALHKSLMDAVESQLPGGIDAEKVRKVSSKDYTMLLTRECTIGGSLCIDTLYEITQRELEAGRMGPTHDLINIAVDAIAEPHYSREQLLRQENKIQKLDSRVTLREKISRMFSR
ncbi:MAG: hypothetical protein ACRBDX_04360 [Gammaproteobacteria bacterium]